MLRILRDENYMFGFYFSLKAYGKKSVRLLMNASKYRLYVNIVFTLMSVLGYNFNIVSNIEINSSQWFRTFYQISPSDYM